MLSCMKCVVLLSLCVSVLFFVLSMLLIIMWVFFLMNSLYVVVFMLCVLFVMIVILFVSWFMLFFFDFGLLVVLCMYVCGCWIDGGYMLCDVSFSMFVCCWVVVLCLLDMWCCDLWEIWLCVWCFVCNCWCGLVGLCGRMWLFLVDVYWFSFLGLVIMYVVWLCLCGCCLCFIYMW